MNAGVTLIVGLGNPGPRYVHTRHNVGRDWVTALALSQGVELRKDERFRGLIGRWVAPAGGATLLLPETFMNLSGESVGRIVQYHKTSPAAVLVVHDELDLLPGVVRLKWGGGANGHRGVGNIIKILGTGDFWRLRVGIGRSQQAKAVVEHVLETPLPAEQTAIQSALQRSLSYSSELLAGDFEFIMNQLH